MDKDKKNTIQNIGHIIKIRCDEDQNDENSMPKRDVDRKIWAFEILGIFIFFIFMDFVQCY